MSLINDISAENDLVETSLAELSGGNFLTYIKPVWMSEGVAFAVCSEDGVELAVFGTADAAYYAARQHNLTPVRLH